MALKIEPLTLDRLGEVRRLFEMMAVEHMGTAPYPTYDDEEVDNFCLITHRNLKDNPYFAAWVAIRGHKTVGFIMCEIQSRAIGKPRYFTAVHWLYTHPRHRERGVARRLLAAGVEWTKANNITHGEWAAIPGDTQWDERGVPSIGHRYAILADSVAALFAPPKVAKIG